MIKLDVSQCKTIAEHLTEGKYIPEFGTPESDQELH